MKKCIECAEEKKDIEFSTKRTPAGGLSTRNQCKTCRSEYKKKRRTELRKWFTGVRKRLSCELCGFNDHRALEFHHMDDDKEYNISHMVASGMARDRIMDEMRKCQVVCANCHAIIHSTLTE